MSGSLAIIDLVFNRARLMLPVRDNGAEINGRGLNRSSFSQYISTFTYGLALIAIGLKLSM